MQERQHAGMHPLTAKRLKLSKTPHELPISSEVHAALAQATERFESNFRSVYVYQGEPDPSHAPTGEHYAQIIVGRMSSADDALDAWIARVAGLIPLTPKDLYWRVKPEINCFDGKKSGYAIYSRFLISDKPRKL